MYIPSSFQLDDAAAWAFVQRHDFGLLLSQQRGPIEGTHQPFAARTANGRRELLAHFARANPQWQGLQGQDVMVVFQGVDGYVSPTWYTSENMVPTWNYEVVHVYGTVRMGTVDDVLAQIGSTADAWEPRDADGSQWTTERLPRDVRDKLLSMIVPVVIEVERVEGKVKMSQNRNPADVAGVLRALEAAADPSRLALAAAIRRCNAATG